MKDYKKINKNNLKSYLDKFWWYKNIKVIFFSIYKPKYTRTETIEILFKELWITYIKNHKFKKNYFIRVFYNIAWLIRNIKKWDIIYVHFRWHEILPIVKVISFLFKKPVIFDMFISMWDTVCFDRKLFKPYSLIGKFIRRYDKFLIKISDFVLVDTFTHLNYFINDLWLAKDKWGFLYVWANENIFHPIKVKKSEKFWVFRYWSVLPLQGIDIILKTAKLLEKNKDIEFFLVWPIKKTYWDLINKLQLTNVIFIDWVSYKDLPKEICKSHLCLWWHFSNIDKAKRVIAGKTFQFLDCGIPTIVWDNEANRELFKKDEKLVKFVKMGNENDLYNLLSKLYDEKY